MNKSNVTIIILIFFFGIGTFSLSAQPGEIRVKEELTILIEELGLEKTDPDTLRNVLVEFLNFIQKSIASFFSFLSKKNSFFIFLLVLILIFLISYFGLKFFTHFRREKNKVSQSKLSNPSSPEENMNNFFSDYIHKAEEHAVKGEYGEALIFLHKASIVYLRIKKILNDSVFRTNREIRRELKTQKLNYEAFFYLALAAERKAFRSEIISGEIYNECLILFENNFTFSNYK